MVPLKKSTSFYAYVKYAKDEYSCENATLVTLMIATGYEEDQRFYKKYSKDSDALVSDSNENFLYYRCGVILLAAQSLRIVIS